MTFFPLPVVAYDSNNKSILLKAADLDEFPETAVTRYTPTPAVEDEGNRLVLHTELGNVLNYAGVKNEGVVSLNNGVFSLPITYGSGGLDVSVLAIAIYRWGLYECRISVDKMVWS